MLVVGAFRDARATVSSLIGVAVLRALIAPATMSVAMTFVDLSWSTSLGGRSKFFKRPARFPYCFNFLMGIKAHFLKTAFPTTF